MPPTPWLLEEVAVCDRTLWPAPGPFLTFLFSEKDRLYFQWFFTLWNVYV